MPDRSPDPTAHVSVVIPCYNAERFIASAIESALAQSYRDLDVIVVDDESTDRSLDAIARFRNDERVRVIRQKNAGVSVARNRGIAESTGDLIAFLDADDFWAVDKIERQVGLLAKNPACGLVHTDIQRVDWSGAPLAKASKPYGYAQGQCTSELLAHNTITTSSVLIRRAALPDAPFCAGLDAGEDWDLWLRVSLMWSIAYISESLTMYREHNSNTSSDLHKMKRGSVVVLERFLANDVSRRLRYEARGHLGRARVTLAHLEYDQGHFTRARSLYMKAPFSGGTCALARLALTLLPGTVRSATRSGWHWLLRATQ